LSKSLDVATGVAVGHARAVWCTSKQMHHREEVKGHKSTGSPGSTGSIGGEHWTLALGTAWLLDACLHCVTPISGSLNWLTTSSRTAEFTASKEHIWATAMAILLEPPRQADQEDTASTCRYIPSKPTTQSIRS